MNLLFFLTPKATCCYLYADYTLRQATERMEHSGYSALPILTREGTYCGTLTEGDLLWATKKLCCMDFRDTEEHSIMEIAHRRDNLPVSVSTDMQDLRDPIDRLELIVDKDIWPVPTYGDLMFEV